MNGDVNRRRVLATGVGLVSAGALFAGSAAAERDDSAHPDGAGLGVDDLTDAIAVANGKAKVKGWAREPGDADISVTTRNGHSATYTAADLAADINRGVEAGHRTVRKVAGELRFDPTSKWRDLVGGNGASGSVRVQSCGGKNTIENGVYYFDQDSFEEILTGIRGAGTVTAIAGVIVGAITTATIGPAVFAIAGLLVAFGAGELAQVGEGCGIKVDPDASNEVQPQDCDC